MNKETVNKVDCILCKWSSKQIGLGDFCSEDCRRIYRCKDWTYKGKNYTNGITYEKLVQTDEKYAMWILKKYKTKYQDLKLYLIYALDIFCYDCGGSGRMYYQEDCYGPCNCHHSEAFKDSHKPINIYSMNGLY
jgi:hypothetical protein